MNGLGVLKECLIGELKSDSHLPKKISFIYFNESPLKMMNNAFLCHLKSSFRSQVI